MSEIFENIGQVAQGELDLATIMLLDKVPEVLTQAQKLTKIHNLLSSQSGKTIRNAGSRSVSQWVLMDQKNKGKQTG